MGLNRHYRAHVNHRTESLPKEDQTCMGTCSRGCACACRHGEGWGVGGVSNPDTSIIKTVLEA